MLAGRKLLLADDSVTIQKVIELTFADEGMEVIAVGDGEQAIEKAEELLPDVILVDVFMPVFNGYEVCEYIKGSEKLKRIPVMLLVGSFEPFDEAEARRVGANDTLTKPFQSIRRLIEKVGELVGNKPPDSEVPTAQLPQQETPGELKLSTAELDIVTADTMKLPEDLKHQAHDFVAQHRASQLNTVAHEIPGPSKPAPEPAIPQTNMEIEGSELQDRSASDNTDALLDLDDFEAVETLDDDDFELELDLDEPEVAPAPIVYASNVETHAAVAPAIAGWEDAGYDRASAQYNEVHAEPVHEGVPQEAEFYKRSYAPAESRQQELDMAPSSISADSLSPEMIDAIARRAVEYLSERVVQNIAWEVVPQLAELLIKRQLEEKESQPK